jgi:pyruvate formate lyase activating enzyme
MADAASPEVIAAAARREGCRSVAYTYNDPVIFHESAIDTALACTEAGIFSVAVTAGYVCDAPRREFYRHMHAANVDLKAFTDEFYHRFCSAQLGPVLDTLRYIARETDVWLEITTLLIPGENDGDEELNAMTRWISEEVGTDVPLHFSAFHPDWKMLDYPVTPASTLQRARSIALANGLRYVYTGNIRDLDGGATLCHHCGAVLIGRDRYELTDWGLDAEGCCVACGTACAGHFDAAPGRWGARRRPLTP